ncbi:MAG TPA: sugar phosphate isomerase/epimerase family protein [Candidatus Polarisedimenticolia bacterium]|nr:sugar phosphate isomerase/epimerase family protein [Candidatus Polarisedimenticolia bacterium]
MKLGVCLQVFYDRSLDEALASAARLGFQAVELPVDAHSPLVDLDEALDGGWRRIRRQLETHGLELSALSNHQEGQLLLGPHGRDTDGIFRGTPAEKAARAQQRLAQTARLAERMEVRTVIAFTGCEDYSRWFPWPDPDGYEAMGPAFREAMLPLLEDFSRHGVRFAAECHPRQFAYNLETAEMALRLVENHPAFGFNLDPANLVLAGMDPVVFAAEMRQRIWHVHAKDAETVRHAVGRSGLLAHGRWDRPGRGFRFRVPGWGDLDWRRLITELHLGGYTGVLAVEHEDPTMSREEGLIQARNHLAPLLLHQPPPGDRWW